MPFAFIKHRGTKDSAWFNYWRQIYSDHTQTKATNHTLINYNPYIGTSCFTRKEETDKQTNRHTKNTNKTISKAVQATIELFLRRQLNNFAFPFWLIHVCFGRFLSHSFCLCILPRSKTISCKINIYNWYIIWRELSKVPVCVCVGIVITAAKHLHNSLHISILAPTTERPTDLA